MQVGWGRQHFTCAWLTKVKFGPKLDFGKGIATVAMIGPTNLGFPTQFIYVWIFLSKIKLN